MIIVGCDKGSAIYSISLKTVVIFIDAMHNEESNRKKPKDHPVPIIMSIAY